MRSGGLVAAALVWAAGAWAQPVTWNFDLTTAGQDAHWLSPTPVANHADQYVLSYELTKLEVTVKYLFFTTTVDETDQIPAADRTRTGVYVGPPPVAIFSGDLVYPDPPAAPSAAAHVVVGLNAAGYGAVDVTSVYLGTAQVDLGAPFGVVTVQITKLHIAGTLLALAKDYPTGDLNCDGVVDFKDINPLVLALSDAAGYQAAFPTCPLRQGDCNGDGVVNFKDINPFIAILGGP